MGKPGMMNEQSVKGKHSAIILQHIQFLMIFWIYPKYWDTLTLV